MDLDALFGGSGSGTDVDVVETIEADAEIEESEEVEEVDAESDGGLGWKVLVLFICGGLVITTLVVAFMVWVIEALVL